MTILSPIVMIGAALLITVLAVEVRDRIREERDKEQEARAFAARCSNPLCRTSTHPKCDEPRPQEP